MVLVHRFRETEPPWVPWRLPTLAHEQALESFVRRALGEQEGDPLEAILALHHV